MNTKQIIIDAAFKLFETKDFEHISIQQILDEAHVSRKTFYKYFYDKYELMHMYYSNYVEENILKYFDGSNWCETQALFFDFAREKSQFFMNVYDIKGQEDFWSYVYNYTYDFYKKIKLKNNHQKELSEIEHYTIHAIVNAEVSVLKAYIRDKSKLPSLEISRLLCELIPYEYQNYID